MFGRSAESKSEKSDHKVGKVGSLINLWELTKCGMHRTFTGKSLQLKLRSVRAIHHQFNKQSIPTPWSDPSKAGCILYFVYKTYALGAKNPVSMSISVAEMHEFSQKPGFLRKS